MVWQRYIETHLTMASCSRLMENNQLSSLPESVFKKIPLEISTISLWGNALTCYPMPSNKNAVAIGTAVPFCATQVRAKSCPFVIWCCSNSHSLNSAGSQNCQPGQLWTRRLWKSWGFPQRLMGNCVRQQMVKQGCSGGLPLAGTLWWKCALRLILLQQQSGRPASMDESGQLLWHWE